MIRKIVSTSILVFSFILCTTSDVSAQPQANNTSEVHTRMNGKIRITTMTSPAQPVQAEPSIEQLQAEIQHIEANIIFARQNQELIDNGSLYKSEKALIEKKAALKQKQEAQH